jgi:hypothetical protein
MSGPAVGLETVFGCAVESTYGTPVVCDRFFEILGGESLKRNNRTLVSQGMRGGARNLRRGSRRVVSGRDASGNVPMEVATTGFGRWFQQLLGTAPVITSLGGSPAAFQHVYAMGSVLGRSTTCQKQIRDAGGTVIETLTYPGSKMVVATFSVSVQQILQFVPTFDCQDERTDISPAAASYTTQKLFTFQGASLSIGGSSAANVLDASLTVTNPEKVDRFYLGNQGLKAEPVDSDFPAVTGTFKAEVLDATLYNLFVNDTPAALVLSFVGDTISGANHETLTLTVPEIHLTGESAQVGGPGVIEQSLPWEAAADPASDPGMSITYITKDAAA